jgi:alkylation response protein AidB-like acyl-CoA dehydrogenase
MRFDWDDGQQGLHLAFSQLGEEKLGQDVTERDRAGSPSRADWDTCASRGVQRLLLPREYGGGGCDPVTYAYAMEGLGHGCVDNGLLMSVGAHILAAEVPLWKVGDERQRQRYLPRLAAGRLIGAHAITEIDAGSDALAVTTTAERDGDGYRLNGRKCYVTNAPVADVFIVYATIDPRLGFTGVTAFVVERDDPGLFVEAGPDKMGLRTAAWGSVILRDCRVPIDRRLGLEKQGSNILSLTMAWERSLILAPWLGVLGREIDRCMSHCRRRRQFGRHIAHFQAVSDRLVDMRARLEAARLLVYRAASELDVGRPSIYPELAKLFTSETAVAIFTEMTQVYGAVGYTTACGVERHLRDAIGMRTASGTSDMQRVVLAGKLGLALPEPHQNGSGRVHSG